MPDTSPSASAAGAPEAACQSARDRCRRLLPFLNWTRPDRALLQGEALAGLTVGLMVIPQGVAYAALAGMPLVTGIYASLLPALVAVLFSSSMRLSVGPTALSCLLISASLNGLATPGSAEWVNLAVWLALLAGAVQVVLGLLRLGWFLNLVSAPVLTGFTQAAAVLIILSQLPDLLGWPGGADTAWAPANWNLWAAGFGLVCLGLLVLSRRWRPAFPSVLLLVLASAGLSVLWQLESRGVAVVGVLPHGMPGLQWPVWPGWSSLGQLLLPVLLITLISFLETAASAKVDNAGQGTRWNQNQDLIGQGLAKLAAGLNGAFPTSSSFSRSALNLYAGARSGWATVFAVAVVAVCLQWFLPLLHHVPQLVLAAIVIVAVIGLIRPRELVRLWRVARVEAVIALLTFAATVLASPQLYWGVLVGVLLALSHFLYGRLHPRIIEVGLHGDGRLRDRHLWNLPALAPRVLAIRMDAALDFGSAQALEQAVGDHLAVHRQPASVLADAYPTQRFSARVLSIAPLVDAQRGAVEVKFSLPQPLPDFLREDMTLSVEVQTARRERTLVVPADALRSDTDGGASVWLVREGRVQARPVRLGLRTLDAAEILDGLREGERVLVGAAPPPGQRVRIGTTDEQPLRSGTGRSEDAGAAMSQAMGR